MIRPAYVKHLAIGRKAEKTLIPHCVHQRILYISAFIYWAFVRNSYIWRKAHSETDTDLLRYWCWLYFFVGSLLCCCHSRITELTCTPNGIGTQCVLLRVCIYTCVTLGSAAYIGYIFCFILYVWRAQASKKGCGAAEKEEKSKANEKDRDKEREREGALWKRLLLFMHSLRTRIVQ